MKESIGTTYLFQIVIVFVLLFTGYLCLSINYSRSYAVKNSIVHAIEREKGMNERTKTRIHQYLSKVGFRSSGKCPDGYTGYDINGEVAGGGKGVYCVEEIVSQEATAQLPRRSYYRVAVFYKLDLPIFNSVFSFKNYGDTYQIFESEN